MNLFYECIDTPLGNLTIEADSKYILGVFYDKPDAFHNPNALTIMCKNQLSDYFNGELQDFNLPLKFQGTGFQKQAWQALLKVPFGQTATYGQQAVIVNNPKAVRAVGTANSKNKLSIVVPCHRIIGANGKLTGYAGGLERKRWLLDHEKRFYSPN